MLSETDVHYLTAFLYLATHSEDIKVVLGEKVTDVASESDRDVDIVIVESPGHGLIGVEVKDESRPLHVGLVEALCQKFADMPSIIQRWIVSSSGFTEPAVRKASAHNVQCLRFVRGRLPRFHTIDISHVSSFPIAYLEWRDGPHLTLAPRLSLSPQQRAELNDDVPVRTRNPTATSPRTARELADRVVAAATAEWSGPDQMTGPVQVSLDIEIADFPVLELPSGPLTIQDAQISGVVEWVTTVVPPEATCYLETLDGTPMAGAIVVAIRTGLLGMSASPSSQRLRFFHIPAAVRNIRPIRTELSRSAKAGA